MARRLVILILFLLMAPAAARAEIDVRAVLGDLGNDDYAVRERATTALLANDALTPDEIKRLYAAATLPEQRHRLLDVARHHMVRRQQKTLSRRGGPGSLGLGLVVSPPAPPNAPGQDGSAPPGPVAARVAATYPGFPAYVVLKPGDLIFSIDGQPVPVVQRQLVLDSFVQMIKAHPAGSNIRLSISHDGKAGEVTVRLASFEALAALYAGEFRLRPPFDAEWIQLRTELTAAESSAEPLKVPLDPTAAATAAPAPAPTDADQDGDDADGPGDE